MAFRTTVRVDEVWRPAGLASFLHSTRKKDAKAKFAEGRAPEAKAAAGRFSDSRGAQRLRAVVRRVPSSRQTFAHTPSI